MSIVVSLHNFRIFASNFGSLIAISDPKLAQKLYQNQTNMAHAWDLGMGHFLYRFIGKVQYIDQTVMPYILFCIWYIRFLSVWSGQISSVRCILLRQNDPHYQYKPVQQKRQQVFTVLIYILCVKAMGFAKGQTWNKHRKTFRTSMSSAAANASLDNMLASLDDWESQVLGKLEASVVS